MKLMRMDCLYSRLTWSQSGSVHHVGADTLKECGNRNAKVVGLVRIRHGDSKCVDPGPLKQCVVLILESNEIYIQTIVNT